MNPRSAVFVGSYVALTVAVAWAFRWYLVAGHSTIDISRSWLLIFGPMITLAVGHGVEIYLLATAIVLPLGVVALTTERKGWAAAFGAMAVAVWLCFGWFLS